MYPIAPPAAPPTYDQKGRTLDTSGASLVPVVSTRHTRTRAKGRGDERDRSPNVHILKHISKDAIRVRSPTTQGILFRLLLLLLLLALSRGRAPSRTPKHARKRAEKVARGIVLRLLVVFLLVCKRAGAGAGGKAAVIRPGAVERVVFFPAFRIGEDVVGVCDLFSPGGRKTHGESAAPDTLGWRVGRTAWNFSVAARFCCGVELGGKRSGCVLSEAFL